MAAVGIGAVSISPLEVLAILARGVGLSTPWTVSEQQETVLAAIRIPRVLASAVVGAAWAGAGVAMQGQYRTPLADPALLGVGAGAALGAAVGITTAVSAGVAPELGGALLVTAGSFAGALAGAFVVHRVASASGRVVVATMLLGGIAVTAILGALTALLVAAGRRPELASFDFWSLGSFSGAVGHDVLIGTLVVVPVLFLLARLGPQLDALALGESEARHLGVDVRALAIVMGVCFALLTAVAVAIAGVIAFVALLVPGLARPLVGPGHRGVVVGAGLLGATFLVIADVLARSLFSPVELSVGIITTLVGAPFFLWLLLRDRGLLAR